MLLFSSLQNWLKNLLEQQDLWITNIFKITIKTRRIVYKFSFLPRTIIDWNNLSKEVIKHPNNVDLYHNHLISTL